MRRLSVEEYAKEQGISRQTVAKMIQAGTLTIERKSPRRTRILLPDEKEANLTESQLRIRELEEKKRLLTLEKEVKMLEAEKEGIFDAQSLANFNKKLAAYNDGVAQLQTAEAKLASDHQALAFEQSRFDEAKAKFDREVVKNKEALALSRKDYKTVKAFYDQLRIENPGLARKLYDQLGLEYEKV